MKQFETYENQTEDSLWLFEGGENEEIENIEFDLLHKTAGGGGGN
jgi:hypothetical protein